jgi:chromosome segregation ATPase
MEHPGNLKDYYELFIKVFAENCKLDSEDPTQEELEMMGQLDQEEVFQNFASLVSQLLKFKKQIINSEVSDLVKRLNAFENSIQKLENEVRNHIAAQHRLRVVIENQKEKLNDCRKNHSDLAAKIKGQETLLGQKNAELEELKQLSSEKHKLKNNLNVLHSKTKSTANGNHTDDSILVSDQKYDIKNRKYSKVGCKNVRDKSHYNDYLPKSSSQKNKIRTIKSVKFEYFIAKANNICGPSYKNSINNLPESSIKNYFEKVRKPVHIRSSSDILSHIDSAS